MELLGGLDSTSSSPNSSQCVKLLYLLTPKASGKFSKPNNPCGSCFRSVTDVYNDANRELLSVGKMLLRTLQAYAVMFTFSFDLPKINVPFFEFPEMMKLSFDVPSIECEFTGFSSYAMQNFLTPWILFPFFVLAYVVYRLGLFVLMNFLPNKTHKVIPARLKSITALLRFFARCYMLFFLVIAKKTFAFFECMRHPGELAGGSFADSVSDVYPVTHRVFRHVQCGEGEHGDMLVVGFLFVGLNVVLPLTGIFVVYLILRRKLTAPVAPAEKPAQDSAGGGRQDADRFQNAFNFLWSDYRPSCSFFILFLLLKDAGFPLAGILFDDGFRQGVFGALVFLTYIYAVLRFRPLRQAHLNQMEALLVWFQMAILLTSGFSFDRTEQTSVSTPAEQKEKDDFRERRSFVMLALQVCAWVAPVWLAAGGQFLNRWFQFPDQGGVGNEEQRRKLLQKSNFFVKFVRRFVFPGIQSADELRDEAIQHVYVLFANGKDAAHELTAWVGTLSRMEHQELLSLVQALREALVVGSGGYQHQLLKIQKLFAKTQHGRHVSFPTRRAPSRSANTISQMRLENVSRCGSGGEFLEESNGLEGAGLEGAGRNGLATIVPAEREQAEDIGRAPAEEGGQNGAPGDGTGGCKG